MRQRSTTPLGPKLKYSEIINHMDPRRQKVSALEMEVEIIKEDIVNVITGLKAGQLEVWVCGIQGDDSLALL